MKRFGLTLLILALVAGCNRRPVSISATKSAPPKLPAAEPVPSDEPSEPDGELPKTLAEARKGFKTRLLQKVSADSPAATPPPEILRLVRYESPAGKLAAYVSPDPGDGKKHPAIIWIFGGFSNSIGSTAWGTQPAKNDQSASAFRKAGIVMMYPSFRGGNDNPGVKEGFFGEVNDVLAAREYLAQLSFVDPARIYLGGHSTGGTMALLAAECCDKFRAVFSFGPVEDVTGYGAKVLPFNVKSKREVQLRAPEQWLACIQCPTFVFEGASRTGVSNIEALDALAQASKNSNIHFFPIEGGDHFTILAPTTALIAAKIRRDTSKECTIRFTEAELRRPFAK
ncbi:MAG TPA: prolyl oligopeptidase family serine peptidase [Gemmataceae bacterium]|nr:prolyl oligopeptidase family serine peptidase [Gemmataceae bacterium]